MAFSGLIKARERPRTRGNEGDKKTEETGERTRETGRRETEKKEREGGTNEKQRT